MLCNPPLSNFAASSATLASPAQIAWATILQIYHSSHQVSPMFSFHFFSCETFKNRISQSLIDVSWLMITSTMLHMTLEVITSPVSLWLTPSAFWWSQWSPAQSLWTWWSPVCTEPHSPSFPFPILSSNSDQHLIPSLKPKTCQPHINLPIRLPNPSPHWSVRP